jgi:hypothetical protein
MRKTIVAMFALAAVGLAQMNAAAADLSIVIAVVLFFALAVLASTILIIKRMERKDDVLHGGFVENDHE